LLLVVGLVGLGIGNVMITKERDEKDAALRAKTDALEERDKAYTSAEAERRRAEGNLDLALAALDAVYLDAIGRDKLLGEPVSKPDEAALELEEPDFTLQSPQPLTDLERELLKRGLDFYDQFAQKNAAAPRVFVQTAQAYYRVGLLQGALGDAAAAAEAYRGAVERFEHLAKEEPDNAEHFRRLAEAYTGLANVVPDWAEAKETFEKARLAYSSAIDLRSNDISLYLRRGEVFENLSDQRAGQDYERVLQLDPDNVQGHLKCSSYFSGMKSLEHAQRAVALAPDDPDCHVQLAGVLAVSNGSVLPGPGTPGIEIVPDPAPALEHYTRAIELAPERPVGFRARAGFYIKIGHYQRALDDLDRALSLQPDDILSLSARATAYSGLEQFDKARADLAAVTNARPNNAEAHRRLGEIHMGFGDWQAAADSLSRVVEIKPLWSWVYKRRAIAYVNLGQHAQALADLETALEIHPGDTSALWWIPASDLQKAPEDFRQRLLALADRTVERSHRSDHREYVDRGKLHYKLRQYEKADADFAKALQLNPDVDDVRLYRAQNYSARGMHREAREWMSKAIEQDPAHWGLWHGRGRKNFKLGDFGAAVDDFSKALELHPPCRSALSWRCAAYLRLGQLDKARDDVAALRETKAKDYYRHYEHAVLCLALNDEAEYRDSCQTMLDALSEIDDPMAANFVAWACALAPDAVDDYEPVLACAKKAVEARPESDQFLNTLGAILYRAGRNDQAIERLTELDQRRETADGTVQSSPAYTWYFLAMAHQKASNAEQPREYLNKANQWTDEVLADEENPPAWNRRATLELLRKEAEALLGTDDDESTESDQQAEDEE
jgi:tetratricopeptide (TPR) repeat protein